MYDSKLKSNAKWWKIKMKTHNLTQVVLKMIQLIAEFIAIHYAISKTKMTFKMWFLLTPSVNLCFQTLLGHKNVSRS